MFPCIFLIVFTCLSLDQAFPSPLDYFSGLVIGLKASPFSSFPMSACPFHCSEESSESQFWTSWFEYWGSSPMASRPVSQARLPAFPYCFCCHRPLHRTPLSPHLLSSSTTWDSSLHLSTHSLIKFPFRTDPFQAHSLSSSLSCWTPKPEVSKKSASVPPLSGHPPRQLMVPDLTVILWYWIALSVWYYSIFCCVFIIFYSARDWTQGPAHVRRSLLHGATVRLT